VPYPEAGESTHTLLPLFFKFNFNIVSIRFCKVSCTFRFSDENSVHISSLLHVCYMPHPSQSWYRLSHFLKTRHWAPDCSCNCCYTKFQSKIRAYKRDRIFRSQCKLPLMWCQSNLVHSKWIHSQFQTITKYRTLYFIFQWIQNTNGCSQNMVMWRLLFWIHTSVLLTMFWEFLAWCCSWHFQCSLAVGGFSDCFDAHSF
jgi:hypothetical protein